MLAVLSMISLTHCKICGSEKLPVVRQYRARPSLNGDWKHAFDSALKGRDHADIGLVLCVRCGFLFYRDVLAPDEMRNLYATENRIDRVEIRSLKPGRRWLFERMVQFLEPHLRNQLIRTTLDIGPGDFAFTHQLRPLIPDSAISALDPCYPHPKFKDITVFRSMLEEFEPRGGFDLVLAMHVVEHVADLDIFMNKLRSLVDGLLFIEVPFQVGPALFLNRSVSPQHINYFTPNTLRLLLEKHGFSVVAEQFTTDGYRRVGVPGIIRVIAEKSATHPRGQKSVVPTLQHLLNPTLILRERLASRIGL